MKDFTELLQKIHEMGAIASHIDNNRERFSRSLRKIIKTPLSNYCEAMVVALDNGERQIHVTVELFGKSFCVVSSLRESIHNLNVYYEFEGPMTKRLCRWNSTLFPESRGAWDASKNLEELDAFCGEAVEHLLLEALAAMTAAADAAAKITS